MKISANDLIDLTQEIFAAAGSSEAEALCIARHLVEANLVGHDSHGVIRIMTYVQWAREGNVVPNQTVQVIMETDNLAVLDGRSGFGQSIGEQAVQMGIDKAAAAGGSVIALRDSAHLGRIGDWPQMAADANLLSLHFVNTSGKGMLVAPFGGISRRLSACPIAAGVPIVQGDPLILDISGCTMAEGKIRVALNKGVSVPEGSIIDGQGNPTNDPQVFYGDPGAILPFGGHKGYGLTMIAEVLAGALTGGGCTNPKNAGRLHNGMLSIYLDPYRFQDEAVLQQELKRFVEFVKSSETVTPDGEILMPGDPERRTKQRRLAEGIELDETTWTQIQETRQQLKVDG
jgi:uncharacterized oxidoreductase